MGCCFFSRAGKTRNSFLDYTTRDAFAPNHRTVCPYDHFFWPKILARAKMICSVSAGLLKDLLEEIPFMYLKTDQSR